MDQPTCEHCGCPGEHNTEGLCNQALKEKVRHLEGLVRELCLDPVQGAILLDVCRSLVGAIQGGVPYPDLEAAVCFLRLQRGGAG